MILPRQPLLCYTFATGRVTRYATKTFMHVAGLTARPDIRECVIPAEWLPQLGDPAVQKVLENFRATGDV